MAHVPGPWWVDDRRPVGGKLQIQAQHRGEGSSYCVASINHWEAPEECARLIAIAPEMYTLLTRLASHTGSDDPRLELVRATRALLSRIEASHAVSGDSQKDKGSA